MVSYLRCLNKYLLLSVPMFCLRFLSPLVHNYSNYVLNSSERYLLSLGLNFRPTPHLLNANVLNRQFDDFVRSVRIKYFFRDCNTNVFSHQYYNLRVKSQWAPPSAPPWIELPLLAIKHELYSLFNHRHHLSSNVSRSELFALSKLRSIEGIRILAADKNLGPTIVTNCWYKEEVSRLLSNVLFYKRVDTVPFISMKNALTSILERYGHSLGDKLKSYILQYADVHIPAHFKILPKVHKSPMVGRPIVASTKFLTTPASRFIDCTLSPLLSSLPSYVKDSSDIIRQLNNLTINPDCFLVTADVSSLYTNIPVKDCIVAIDLFCRSQGCEITALITELSRFVLTNNYFEAEGVLYHQLWGLAMGTPMAVSAAVIYMASLEEPLLTSTHLEFYKRFIDDIFFVWSGNLSELNSFLDKLNNLAPTIKLTWNISKEKAIFLDMIICKDKDFPTKLITKPYQKPLNRYLYIPFNSYHPNHSKKSFIKAELIRYVRLSSKVSDFLKIRDSFYNRLRNRGYPKWFLTEIFSEVSYNLRSSYLSVKKNRASGLAHKLFFKTNRNPLFNGVHLRKLFLFHLCNDFDVTICYKATPNLAKFVSRKLFRAT